MAEEPDHIPLQYMRRFDERQERMADDLKDIKFRLTQVEGHFGSVELGLAGVQRRIDRVEQRLDRIETRLDPVDSPFGGVRE